MADYRWVFLPYCIKRLDDGRHVVLNRSYKPLGSMTKEHIAYEPHGVKFKGLTKTVAAKLSWEKSPDVATIYLYNDGCVPTASKAHMTAYLKRLALLAKVKIARA